ncbi:hypothetical protein I6N90_08875 [Paenibacillus sp. GSMTC-2017]|uniref:hypothetical protein n=1 Tax=Paenibacillus sp. GSMTC-2017 TaxID=2794350 RepID=UPI001A2637B3|nr:hypothetical protein [Paenibacillus sp. GSMTC-2017]MBH5317915.1 hypothetical protein [Paenibacillus sp. GSMTC-2017]
MTPKRWKVVIVLAIITFGLWFGFYFREIQSPRWSEEKAARDIALATNLIKEVTSINKHVWEQTTWITEGIDQNDRALYLFHKDKELLHTIDASVTLSKESVKSNFNKLKPEAEVIRLSPALFLNNPAWELYYSETVDGTKRYYYDFYTFDKEFKLLNSYKLPTKTGP